MKTRNVTTEPEAIGVTMHECATALKLSPKQIKYAVESGAPVVRRGNKGRGHSTLVDPAAVAAWLNERGRATKDDRWQVSRRLTQSVAGALCDQFRRESGPHKRAVAVSLVQSFIAVAAAIHDEFGLPLMEPEELPDCIKQMAKVVAIFAE